MALAFSDIPPEVDGRLSGFLLDKFEVDVDGLNEGDGVDGLLLPPLNFGVDGVDGLLNDGDGVDGLPLPPLYFEPPPELELDGLLNDGDGVDGLLLPPLYFEPPELELDGGLLDDELLLLPPEYFWASAIVAAKNTKQAVRTNHLNFMLRPFM